MTRYITWEGDSLTAAASGYPNGGPANWANNYAQEGQAFTINGNFAIANAVIGTRIDNFGDHSNCIWGRADLVEAAFVPGTFNLLVVMIGKNTNQDITNRNSMFAYHDYMANVGYVVVGCTITPSNVSDPTSGWTQRDNAFNTAIRNSVGTHIVDCIDFAAHPIMGNDNAPVVYAGTLYADATHPTSTGYKYLSIISYRVLETLITPGSRNLRLA